MFELFQPQNIHPHTRMTRTYRRRFDRAEQHGTTDTTERRTMLRLASVVGAACDAFFRSRGLPSCSWRSDAAQANLEAMAGQASEAVTHAHPESLERFDQTPSEVPFSHASKISKKRGNPKHESKVTH